MCVDGECFWMGGARRLGLCAEHWRLVRLGDLKANHLETVTAHNHGGAMVRPG